jgi:DNA-binding transcriptional MerR regulator
MNAGPVYTISDLAEEFSVTPRTIRHYEDEGLLTPQRKGQSRLFSVRDRIRLKLALRSKRLGMSLSEIRDLFELHDRAQSETHRLEEFLAQIAARRSQLEQQREDIEVMLNEMTFFESQCRKQLTERADKS